MKALSVMGAHHHIHKNTHFGKFFVTIIVVLLILHRRICEYALIAGFRLAGSHASFSGGAPFTLGRIEATRARPQLLHVAFYC